MVFYKYARKSGIKIIQDLRLKITPPNEFNDPFELTPRSKFALTVADMVNRVKTNPNFYRGVFETIKKDGDTFERFIAELPTILPLQFKKFKKLMREELVKLDMKSLDEASQFFGILSVSKTANSIPMWSHYADHHSGIAIGLDLPNIGKAFGPFKEVKYHKYRRGFNPWIELTNPKGFADRLGTFFIKSKDWLYEQEYRRVFQLKKMIRGQPDKRGKYHFFVGINGSDIREIIFGCHTKKAYENRVRAELNRRPKIFEHVELFRCKRHNSRFELEIIPC